MTPETVLEIRRRAAAGEEYGVIAVSLGLNKGTVRCAAIGAQYRNVGGPLAPPRRVEHGLSKTPEYGVWTCIIKRCTCPTAKDYARYGGAGIGICARWRASFLDFLADMGPRPSPKHSIDRKDNAVGYEPGNCRWATDAEQRRNKRTTRMIEFGGERLCVADMARKHGLAPFVVYSRLRIGWSVERALTEPVCR